MTRLDNFSIIWLIWRLLYNVARNRVGRANNDHHAKKQSTSDKRLRLKSLDRSTKMGGSAVFIVTHKCLSIRAIRHRMMLERNHDRNAVASILQSFQKGLIHFTHSVLRDPCVVAWFILKGTRWAARQVKLLVHTSSQSSHTHSPFGSRKSFRETPPVFLDAKNKCKSISLSIRCRFSPNSIQV